MGQTLLEAEETRADFHSVSGPSGLSISTINKENRRKSTAVDSKANCCFVTCEASDFRHITCAPPSMCATPNPMLGHRGVPSSRPPREVVVSQAQAHFPHSSPGGRVRSCVWGLVILNSLPPGPLSPLPSIQTGI